MKPIANPTNPKTLALMQEVADDVLQLGPLMFHIKHHARCDEILVWLKESKLTGFNLEKWMFIENNNSILGTIKEIVRRMEREDQVRAVIVGKDYRPNR